MTKLSSRRLFQFEMLLIAAPWSIAFVCLGIGLLVPPLLLTPLSPAGAIGLLAVISLGALLSAWVLALSFLRGGNQTLRQRSHNWWVLGAMGALVLAAALSSHPLPSSPHIQRPGRFDKICHYFCLAFPCCSSLKLCSKNACSRYNR